MQELLARFGRDVRYGTRSLLRAPAVSIVAVLSLALGIMATTGIYSVLHAVVIDPFPYRDVDRLMSVRVANAERAGSRTYYSVDQFLEIAARNTIFEGTIASTISDVLWPGDGEPQRLRGNHGTFNTFDVMGVPALLGRTPTPADARPGADPVVVLGYRFWQRQFGGDAGVLGRRLRLNDTVRTVIGVMSKRFMWRGADVYLPTGFERDRLVEGVRSVHVLGRLKAGVSDAQAEADITPIIADLKTREPAQFPDRWRVGLLPFKATFPSSIAGDVWVLFGAVGLLLTIACANVSNLLLSRASARRREMTTRVVLGASRGTLLGQLLTESLVLSLAAGAIGTGLAYLGLPALLRLVPPGTIPDESEIVVNASVLAFALVVSAATSIACGLAPALNLASRDLSTAMRESSRSLAGSSRQAIVRKALVVAEVALSLVLLSSSAVLLRSFFALERVSLAVPPDHLLTFRVPLAPQRYGDTSRRTAFFREVLPRMATVPGVAAVGLNSGLHPLGNVSTEVDVAGEPAVAESVQIHSVNAGYTEAFGIRLKTGRLLTASDVDAGSHVVLANERFVQTRLAGRNPLGRVLRVPRMKEPPLSVADDSFQIVGVVHDVPNAGLAEPLMPELYVPFSVTGLGDQVVVRTVGRAAEATRALVNQVYAVDNGQPVASILTMDRLLQEREYATPRFNLVLLTCFAAAGLVLALVGVYGVMSSAVAQERQEIGVRMALGADGPAIVRMVVARGTRLLVAGAALGIAISLAVSRWIAAEVWRVGALDPLALGAVSVLLLAVGLQACYWPARRASRTDPLIALRELH